MKPMYKLDKPTFWERIHEVLKNRMEDTMIWKDILECGKVRHSKNHTSLRSGYGYNP